MLQNKDLSSAKTTANGAWKAKASKYSLGRDDAFTDGFWGGRLWALARVIDLVPEEDRAEAARRLGIMKREAVDSGMPLIEDMIEGLS
jgi:hypothetical protein